MGKKTSRKRLLSSWPPGWENSSPHRVESSTRTRAVDAAEMAGSRTPEQNRELSENSYQGKRSPGEPFMRRTYRKSEEGGKATVYIRKSCLRKKRSRERKCSNQQESDGGKRGERKRTGPTKNKSPRGKKKEELRSTCEEETKRYTENHTYRE